MIRISYRNLYRTNGVWWYECISSKAFSSSASDYSEQAVPVGESPTLGSYSDIPKVHGLPIIGTINDWVSHRRKLDQLFQKRVAEYGPIYREKIGFFSFAGECVFTANPEDWEAVCRAVELRGNTSVRKGTWSTQAYTDETKRPGFISDLQGDDYKRIKESVTSLMKPKEIATNVPILSDVTDDFTKLLETRMNEDGVVENIRQMVHMWTFECGASIVFRTKLGILDPDNEDEKLIEVFNASQTFFKHFGTLEFGAPHHKTKMTSVWREYRNALETLFGLTKYYFEKHGEYVTDKDCDLTDEERESIAMSILVTASDTTAHTALWALIELSLNPDVQENLYEELTKSYSGGQLTYKNLQLPYLRGFMKEVFRMRPIIPFLNRILPNDLILSGYSVPAGTSVLMLLSAYDQNEVYTNASNVQPERWKRQHRSADHNSFTVLPFGFGQRSCLGRRLAENELYLFIAKMVYNYRIHPVKDYNTTFGLFATPEGEIDFRLEKRN